MQNIDYDYLNREIQNSMIYHAQKTASGILMKMARMGLEQDKISLCCDTVLEISKAIDAFKLEGNRDKMVSDIGSLRYQLSDQSSAGKMIQEHLDHLLHELH